MTIASAPAGIGFGDIAAGGEPDDLFFLVHVGVIDEQVEEKAVELSLRQRIGALVFDGVLGRVNDEGFLQLPGLARHGDLFFLHGLQQGALHFGGGTIDLIGQ